MDPNAMTGVQGIKYNLIAMAKLFDSLSKSCFKKCVSRFGQADLLVGEMTCTDRCTLKFMQTSEIVSQELQKAQQQEMKQQQAVAQMQNSFGS
ncbi:hypothetical protein AAMO2058_001619900 [Amorphochlora amoebiformis]